MSTTTESPSARERAVRAGMLLATGLLFAFAALSYNELLLGLVSSDGTLLPATVAHVRVVQLWFTAGAVLFLGSAAVVARRRHTVRTRARPIATKLLTVAIVTFVPLAMAELALRPFWAAREPGAKTTTIFMRDADLGWRLRPNADDVWDGVRVRVNAKGLRGPELPYEKPQTAFRVVWLGDSVTFGHGLEHDEETFPYVVERHLREKGLFAIQTVNAGVGGWSPWQERRWFETEGVRYAPNLVVVSFVLDDVVEPLGLARFGGSGEGFQLARTASRWRLEERSALFSALRMLVARARWGSDVKAGAVRHETLGVRTLAEQPELSAVQEAWRVTLGELDALFRFCRDRNIDVALVVFPFTFQFENPEQTSAPQRVLTAFARDAHVLVLDLLPLLAARLARDHREPHDYFLDADHPSVLGNEVIGGMIAEFLARSEFGPR